MFFIGEKRFLSDDAENTLSGTSTVFREPVKLTEHIVVFDNRGMNDLDNKWTEEMMAQIRENHLNWIYQV